MRRIPVQPVLALCLLAIGCSSTADTLSPEQQIVRRVLQGLSAGGHPICVDNRAEGGSLQLWRASMVIARVAGRSLGWQHPVPLRPPADMPAPRPKNREQATAIKPLPQRSRLPHQELVALDAAANRLAQQPDNTGPIILRSYWMPNAVTSRWWPLNRISSCEPYRLSAPHRVGDLAFVQVQSNHWGTVYALRRAGAEWRIFAQAAPWLY